MDINTQIKEWVTVDNELKQYNEKIKYLREKRNSLEKNIFNNTNSYTVININNEKLKIMHTKVTEPLTFKYLEKSLGEIIKSETQVKQIIEHIKEKREVKYISEIKRFSNN
jgi:hypothetical protein